MVPSSMQSRRMLSFTSYLLPLLGTAAVGGFHSAPAAAQGAQSQGETCFGTRGLNAVPINVPLKEGRLVHPMLLVAQASGSPSPNNNRRQPQPSSQSHGRRLRSLNCVKGLMCLLKFWNGVWQAQSSSSRTHAPQDRLADRKKVTGLRVTGEDQDH